MAKIELEKGLKLSETINSDFARESIYEEATKLYRELENYQFALFYNDSLTQLTKKIYNNDSIMAVAKLDFESQLSKMEEELLIVSKSEQKFESKFKTFKSLMYLLVVIAIGLVFYLNRVKTENKRKYTLLQKKFSKIFLFLKK